MPCYNVGKTLERAFESILMQQITFKYEVLVIDDCSDDDTPAIIQKYHSRFENFRCIRNDRNKGNAYSFYVALENTKSPFFTVLDGDDFYTYPRKLEKQVQFLLRPESDQFIGVCHYHVSVNKFGEINLPQLLGEEKEFDLLDFISEKIPYCQTATYVYRNWSQGIAPKFLMEDEFRGDTIRTFLALFYSNKKIKIMNFVGSVYYESGDGIWTSLKRKGKLERSLKVLKAMEGMLSSPLELSIIRKRLGKLENSLKNKCDVPIQTNWKSISETLNSVRAVCNKLAFNQPEFIFQHLYGSEYLDSLSSSVGYIDNVFRPLSTSPKVNQGKVVIVTPLLNPHGGGIFSEILDLIDVNRDKEVLLLLADTETVPELAVSSLKTKKNLHIKTINQNAQKYSQLKEILYLENAKRNYFYVGHNSPHIEAVIQPVLRGEKIQVFSYDHGFVLGLFNCYTNAFIVKRPIHLEMLRKLGHKTIFIPSPYDATPALSFEGNVITTATAAARFYKLKGAYPIDILELIKLSLKKGKRRHIHFGPIPKTQKEEISNWLKVNDLNSDSFLNIPWAEDLGAELKNYKVSLFIGSFPIMSYKTTLTALSAAIPVIIFDYPYTHLSTFDAIYNNVFKVKTKDEFLKLLDNLDSEALAKHSEFARSYISKFHDPFLVTSSFNSLTDYPFIPRNNTSSVDEVRDVTRDGLYKEVIKFKNFKTDQGFEPIAIRLIRQHLPYKIKQIVPEVLKSKVKSIIYKIFN